MSCDVVVVVTNRFNAVNVVIVIIEYLEAFVVGEVVIVGFGMLSRYPSVVSGLNVSLSTEAMIPLSGSEDYVH